MNTTKKVKPRRTVCFQAINLHVFFPQHDESESIDRIAFFINRVHNQFLITFFKD